MDNFSVTPPAPVPEPGTLILAGTGLFSLAGLALRKKKRG
jgi:hypothetical protein